MADFSARYALPFMQSGQAQKEVTHNSAVAALDALLCLTVESRTLTTPPATSPGTTAWIVAAGATGAWAGHSGHAAIFDASGWSFVVPPDGCLAFIRAEAVFAYCLAGTWHADAWPARALVIGGRTMLAAVPVVIPTPAGGSVIDVEARAGLAAVLTTLRAMGLVAN